MDDHNNQGVQIDIASTLNDLDPITKIFDYMVRTIHDFVRVLCGNI
jgi:hypothetical protein